VGLASNLDRDNKFGTKPAQSHRQPTNRYDTGCYWWGGVGFVRWLIAAVESIAKPAPTGRLTLIGGVGQVLYDG
jgi:hypothetical protein